MSFFAARRVPLGLRLKKGRYKPDGAEKAWAAGRMTPYVRKRWIKRGSIRWALKAAEARDVGVIVSRQEMRWPHVEPREDKAELQETIRISADMLTADEIEQLRRESRDGLVAMLAVLHKMKEAARSSAPCPAPDSEDDG